MPNRDGTGPWWSKNKKEFKTMNEKQNEVMEQNKKIITATDSDVNSKESVFKVGWRGRGHGNCNDRGGR